MGLWLTTVRHYYIHGSSWVLSSLQSTSTQRGGVSVSQSSSSSAGRYGAAVLLTSIISVQIQELLFVYRIPQPCVVNRRQSSRKSLHTRKNLRCRHGIEILFACHFVIRKFLDLKQMEFQYLEKRNLFLLAILTGKIHLESDWSEEEVFNEIRSVFCGPKQNESNFPFDILQLAGSGTKSLVVPALSSSFKWTPKEVAGRYDSTVYILCKKNIMKEICVANLFNSLALV